MLITLNCLSVCLPACLAVWLSVLSVCPAHVIIVVLLVAPRRFDGYVVPR